MRAGGLSGIRSLTAMIRRSRVRTRSLGNRRGVRFYRMVFSLAGYIGLFFRVFRGTPAVGVRWKRPVSRIGRGGVLTLYPRHRLDVSVGDLIFGLSACLWASRRRRLAELVVRACPPGDDTLVCFSVRSGFDLLLGVLAETPRSEVLISAVTHPDMVRIIEGHGLRAIPVDLDLDTLEPRVELLEEALSPRTCAVVVAHLFGGRFDLGPVAAFARKHGLLLVEDCAQAFRGPWDQGDPRADVSMFSFGSIKTASAIGGAILRVRDPGLLAGLRRVQERWPVQGRRHYAGRLGKALCLVVLGRPLPYGILARICELTGRDLDDLVNGTVRAFPDSAEANGALLGRIRRQPSAPLLALLAWRLRNFDAARLARRTQSGERIARRLPASVPHPGGLAPTRTHWLFPVVVSDPEKLVFALWSRGFDASRVTSNLAPVPAPSDLPLRAPEGANRMMSDLVFLPVYPELPEEALERVAGVVEEVAGVITLQPEKNA
jgi:perosamine synthetase